MLSELSADLAYGISFLETRRRQDAVPHETADVFERRFLHELLDGVSTDHQSSQLAIDIAQSRPGDHDAVQSARGWLVRGGRLRPVRPLFRTPWACVADPAIGSWERAGPFQRGDPWRRTPRSASSPVVTPRGTARTLSFQVRARRCGGGRGRVDWFLVDPQPGLRHSATRRGQFPEPSGRAASALCPWGFCHAALEVTGGRHGTRSCGARTSGTSRPWATGTVS